MNISKADFDRLNEKSASKNADAEDQIVTIQGLFAALDTDAHAQKYDNDSYVPEGFTKVVFKINTLMPVKIQ